MKKESKLQLKLFKEIEKLRIEIKKLKKQKRFGLVWEDKPEKFDKESKNALPVLKEKRGKFKDVISDKEENFNILIEGDNYHSLSVLNYTHRGKIDVIYIDPPYNTGSTDWKYNNDYVDKEDRFRHSKWLSFMNRRLQLAKSLLSDEGFFVCAIDANELHTLGLLLDELFGEQNKLGVVTVLHNPKGRNFTSFFSANSEYMLVYAKNISKAKFNSVAIDDEIRKSFNLKDKNGKRYRLEPFMRVRTETMRENKPAFWYPIYVSPNKKILSLEPKNEYTEVYPITADGREATWINLPDTFLEKNDGVYFEAVDENGKTHIYRKFYEQQIFKNVWVDQKYQSEFHGTNVLKKILGNNIFNYPKSIYLLIDILKIVAKRHSVVLDFFAGSGTTGHAVMELNKEDKGNRKFILCTNNENKICEDVTWKRIKRVSKGYKKPNGEKVKGLGGNLKYLKTDFIKIDKITDNLRNKMVDSSTEILCLKENTFNSVNDNYKKIKTKIFNNSDKYTAILFDLFYFDDFIKELKKLKDKPVSVYVFSYTKDFSIEEFGDLDIDFTVEAIPEKVLEIYQKIFNF